MGKSHMAIGAVTGLGISTFGADALLPLVVGASVIGSLFPDIDHPKSKMGRALLPISLIASMFFDHRGFTHSATAVALLAIVCFALGAYVDYGIIYWGFLAGYASHILADMFTNAGVELFSPFSNKRYRFMSIRTGTASEAVFVAFAVAFMLLFVAQMRGL